MRPIWLLITFITLATPATILANGKEKPEYPPFDKVVEGMEVIQGFHTLYYNEKEQKLYGLIKMGQLKKPFLLAITISGGVYAGMQWDELLVQWELKGKNLLLVRPNLRYKAPKTTFESVVERTYPETIIRALPILTKGGGGLLVDFSQIFKSDLAGLNTIGSFLLGGSYRMNPALSEWAKLKSFPQNTEIGLDMAFTGVSMFNAVNWTDSADSGRTKKMGVHYSLRHLPRTGYKPRLGDSRVGYFYTAVKDFTKERDERTQFDRNIHRWDLEPVDDKLKLSPPKNPIIFYIEKSVPYRYRRHVREGILEWNKAFEKIGFVDAIVARQQTETEFANLDPEDARYNFFRWTTHGMGFAAGPSRANPLTGEILDADIIFDDSMLRFAANEFQLMTAMSRIMHEDDKLMRLHKRFPKWDLFRHTKKNLSAPQLTKLERHYKFLEQLRERGKPLCMYGHGKHHQLALASLYMKDKGKELSEEFIGEFIKDIVMHEVGHTLGLFHNFKSSSWLKLAKINSKEKPETIAGSVMDYTPTNFAPKEDGVEQGHFFNKTIGPYDYWAIEYGYTPTKDSKKLAAIAEKTAESGHAYGNDYYASFLDPDPHILRWDLGDDHVAYAKQKAKLMQQLMKGLVDRVVDKGEDYLPARRAFERLFFEYGFSTTVAARYVGGQSMHWDHKGDPNERPPFVVVSVEKQREALKFLAENLFSDKFLQFDPEVLNRLGVGVWSHWDSDEYSGTSNNIHNMVLSFQDFALFVMVNPITLDRLHNATLQVPQDQDVMTVAELLDTLSQSIWSELDNFPENPAKWSSRKPFISSFRRNLQRNYLQNWINSFALDRWFPYFMIEDAKTQGWKNLHELAAKLDKVLAHKELLDSSSLAHLMESRASIQHALEARFIK